MKGTRERWQHGISRERDRYSRTRSGENAEALAQLADARLPKRPPAAKSVRRRDGGSAAQRHTLKCARHVSLSVIASRGPRRSPHSNSPRRRFENIRFRSFRTLFSHAVVRFSDRNLRRIDERDIEAIQVIVNSTTNIGAVTIVAIFRGESATGCPSLSAVELIEYFNGRSGSSRRPDRGVRAGLFVMRESRHRGGLAISSN